MWVLILSPNFTGQTLCLLMSAPNSCSGMKNRKVSYFRTRMNCWLIAWMMWMYWGRHAARFGIFFLKLVKMDPFREAITISSICNKVFRTMFLKPDAVGIFPRAGYRMGDRQSIEGLQWLAYMGRTRKIIHAGNGKGNAFARGTQCKSCRVFSRNKRSFWVFRLFLAWVSLHAQST